MTDSAAVPSTLEPVRETFRAVVRAAVPHAGEEWLEVEAIVDGALALRPPGVRRQVVLFLRILGVFSLLRFGRPPSRVPVDRFRGLLQSLERSPVLLLRRGIWGVRTLAFMGYYGRAAARAKIGYRASSRGWGARQGSAGAWPAREGAAGPESVVLVASEVAGDGHA